MNPSKSPQVPTFDQTRNQAGREALLLCPFALGIFLRASGFTSYEGCNHFTIDGEMEGSRSALWGVLCAVLVGQICGC